MDRIEVRTTDDRTAIERFLRRDTPLHLYEIGDLDPFFWPQTRWYGAWFRAELCALALQYAAPGLDSVLLLERRDTDATKVLAKWLCERLTGPFHAHFSSGIGELFRTRGARSAGTHRKMTLADPALLSEPSVDVRRLGGADIPALRELYATSYPGNWFDPRMVATKQYFGAFEGRNLRAAAGIHVFAPEHGVAALGNITTHPAVRGRGWARAVTSAVCQSLRASDVEFIGLNVKADNELAIACYERLGFIFEADYEEWDIDAL